MGTVVYPKPPSVIGIVPDTCPPTMGQVPSTAPPGCLKVILGVNVYPLPELTTSIAETLPLVTVALRVAATEPGFVGD